MRRRTPAWTPDRNNLIGFVMGKAKLAPRPEHTVPRLELCAAALAVELADLISAELDLQLDAITYYSDSKVVLGYICNETRHFYVYVSNRYNVSEGPPIQISGDMCQQTRTRQIMPRVSFPQPTYKTPIG